MQNGYDGYNEESFSGWESHTTLTDAKRDAEGAFPANSSGIVGGNFVMGVTPHDRTRKK